MVAVVLEISIPLGKGFPISHRAFVPFKTFSPFAVVAVVPRSALALKNKNTKTGWYDKAGNYLWVTADGSLHKLRPGAT